MSVNRILTAGNTAHTRILTLNENDTEIYLIRDQLSESVDG